MKLPSLIGPLPAWTLTVFEGGRIVRGENAPTTCVIRLTRGIWACACGCGFRVNDPDLIDDLEFGYTIDRDFAPTLVVTGTSDIITEAA